VFVVPFWFAIGTIVRHSGQIIHWAELVAKTGLPAPPEWLGELPLVGSRAIHLWEDVADDSLRELLQRIRPYVGRTTQWFIEAVGSFGAVLLQFLLTIAVSAVMYAKGEKAADTVRRFSKRLAGSRGEQSAILAAQAIRGVALGVVVTALVQASIGATGLVVAGVPFAAILSAVLFMLCVAQLGPGLVLIPAVIWMYARGEAGWATVLLIFSVVAIAIDNVLRPVLIRRGADLPILLILAGVIGGLVAFGLIGLFLGPTLLAVGYKLLMAWIDEPHQILQADEELTAHR
jgi:predicted PurR-regulated permease PerM